MPMNVLAPGVYTQVIDISDYVDVGGTTVGFLPLICERGPDNQLTRVTRSTFYKLFGEPNINYTQNASYAFGPYVATSFLEESDNLYVIRCLPDTAAFSNVFITTTFDTSNTATEAVDCTTSTVSSLNDIQDITGLFTGLQDGSATYNIVAFHGIGRGEYYNNYQIDLNQHPNELLIDTTTGKGLYVLDVYQKQKTSDRIIGDATGETGATYIDYSVVESFEVSFDPDAKDGVGNSQYIEDIINQYSDHIRCKCNTQVLKEIAKRQLLDSSSGQITTNFANGFINSYTASDTTSYLQISYGIQMENGSDGDLFTTTGIDTTAATNILTNAYAGTLSTQEDITGNISSVTDIETTQFDILLDAGYPTDVKTQIISLANSRRDCIAIIDNGDNKTASAAQLARNIAYNTPYAAIYECYSKIYDVFTAKDIWVPPSYHVARIIGYSDNVSEVWYPIAGFNRAVITNIKELRYNPSRADRELFIKNQINPIVKFQEGYSVFSQRTAYKRSTARQDVNVCRLINYIDRAISTFCRQFIFELNTRETWNLISQEINRFLSEVKTRRGLDAYTINVGASEYDIKLRRVKVDITLQPTRAIEIIQLSYYVK